MTRTEPRLTSDELLLWLRPALTALVEAGAGDGSPLRWDDVCDRFLSAVGIHHRSWLDRLPELRVLRLLLHYVENDLHSDADRWRVLLDPVLCRAVLDRCCTQWHDELRSSHRQRVFVAGRDERAHPQRAAARLPAETRREIEAQAAAFAERVIIPALRALPAEDRAALTEVEVRQALLRVLAK